MAELYGVGQQVEHNLLYSLPVYKKYDLSQVFVFMEKLNLDTGLLGLELADGYHFMDQIGDLGRLRDQRQLVVFDEGPIEQVFRVLFQYLSRSQDAD